ncbi:hypothetical protein BJ742DRAFT_746178 [Cladochytrium replicatum]|nr:hypothetical protein BJ742DRAFT_746178 [Cladochytrium replicatum]
MEGMVPLLLKSEFLRLAWDKGKSLLYDVISQKAVAGEDLVMTTYSGVLLAEYQQGQNASVTLEDLGCSVEELQQKVIEVVFVQPHVPDPHDRHCVDYLSAQLAEPCTLCRWRSPSTQGDVLCPQEQHGIMLKLITSGVLNVPAMVHALIVHTHAQSKITMDLMDMADGGQDSYTSPQFHLA